MVPWPGQEIGGQTRAQSLTTQGWTQMAGGLARSG